MQTLRAAHGSRLALGSSSSSRPHISTVHVHGMCWVTTLQVVHLHNKVTRFACMGLLVLAAVYVRCHCCGSSTRHMAMLACHVAPTAQRNPQATLHDPRIQRIVFTLTATSAPCRPHTHLQRCTPPAAPCSAGAAAAAVQASPAAAAAALQQHHPTCRARGRA